MSYDVYKGEPVRVALSQSSHRQSLPNLSRSSKLSVATVARSSEQQRGATGRRASAQTTPTSSYRLQSQVKQQSPAVSRVGLSKQQVSPMRELKSAATRQPSPSSTLLLAKTAGTARQSSRLTGPTR